MTVAFGWMTALMTLMAVTLFGPAQAQPRVDLTPALLTQADLPAGWRAMDPDDLEDFDLDELSMLDPGDFDLGELGIDPNGACGRLLSGVFALAQSPPLAQAQAGFQRGELGPFLFHSVALLPPGLAERYLSLSEASTIQTFFDVCIPEIVAAFAEDDEFGFGMMFQDLGVTFRATPLPLAQLGDRTLGARLDLTFGVIGTSVVLAHVRRGDAVSSIVLVTDPLSANDSATLIDGLLRRADAKLAGALAGRQRRRLGGHGQQLELDRAVGPDGGQACSLVRTERIVLHRQAAARWPARARAARP